MWHHQPACKAAAALTCYVVVPHKAEVEHAASAASCHPAEPLDHVGTAAHHQKPLGVQDGGDLKPCTQHVTTLLLVLWHPEGLYAAQLAALEVPYNQCMPPA